MLAAVQAGAIGILDKSTLDPEALTACVRAAASGAGVMAPKLLGVLLRSLSRVRARCSSRAASRSPG